MNVLEIKNLHKSFNDNKVIRGLNLTVPENSVFGFVGQNGAGKTTTMKMVLGLLKPDSGEIYVCGEKVKYGETATNRMVGYLPDIPVFYSYMNPAEYLMLCGRITGMKESYIKEKSNEMLSLVGLEESKKRKIGGFSRGMKQRLGIAQALLNEPKLLICDEPTSALDPVGRKEILGIMSAVRGKTTVVFSTHILSDIERICDRAAVLHNGVISMSGTLSELKRSERSNSFTIEFLTEKDAARFIDLEELKGPQVSSVRQGSTVTFQFSDLSGSGQFLIDLLSREKILPNRFEVMEPTLENLYLGVVK